MLHYLIIFYIFLLILEYIWFKYYYNKERIFVNSKEQHIIEYNNQNREEITKTFKKIINERMELLNKMDYRDWLKYNQKNNIIELDGLKYYIFIYESTGLDDKFITRSSYSEEMLDSNFNIQRDIIMNNYFILKMFPPFENLPAEMHSMSLNRDGFNEISYNWINPFINRPIKKNSIFTHYKKNDFDGVIGTGYTKLDLDVYYGNIYFSFLNNFTMIFLHVVMFVVAAILYLMNKSNFHFLFQSMIILFFSWFFLVTQLSYTASNTDITLETDKLNLISSNILGVSFLMAVNIFIINMLNELTVNVKKMAFSVRNEIVFLFFMVVVFLLISLINKSNYKDVHEIRNIRVFNQLNFNFAIFYNLIICCLFIIFMFQKDKDFKLNSLVTKMINKVMKTQNI